MLTLVSGCNGGESQKIVESVKNQISSATDQIAPVANEVASQTSEQASKVLRYEYKVETVKKDSDDRSIEATLNKLGEDRWECFSVIATDTGTRITCKRVPYAALRYFLKLM
jgi:hypothetical protein